MRNRFSRRLDGRIVLVVLSITAGLLFIHGQHISSHDEERVAGIAREMIIDGDYLHPRLNGEPFNEYPFLGYHPFVAAFRLFGTFSPFVDHLPGILLGTATVWLTFLIGNLLGGKRCGLVAGFILQMTPGFIDLSRTATVDSALLFAVTLSLYGFLAACDRPDRRTPYLVLFYSALAAGFLVKGVIGVAIPAAVAAVYLLVARDIHMTALLCNWAVLCLVLPVLFWAGSLERCGGKDIIHEVLQQSLFRFISPYADHSHPIYFYCFRILGQLAPWPLLALPLLWLRFGPAKCQIFKLGRKGIFPLVWCLTLFFALSMASAKRPIYLGPIFPPFSLIAAMTWERLRQAIRVPLVVEAGFPALCLITLALLQIFVIQPGTTEESHQSIFNKASSVGAPIYLYKPNESLRGGAVLYLGHKVPVLKSEEDLLSLLDDHGAKVVLALVQDEPSGILTILEHDERVQTLMRRDGGGRNEYRLYSIMPKEALNS